MPCCVFDIFSLTFYSYPFRWGIFKVYIYILIFCPTGTLCHFLDLQGVFI